MFVLDGRKARVAALALAAVTAIPLFPRAKASEASVVKAAAPVVFEVQPVKKSKKKKPVVAAKPKPATKTVTKPVIAWGPKPVFHDPVTKLTKQAALKLVIATARKQLGKPYHYGSAGPSSFDCSGLTMFVWHRAGVSLPHSSRGQYSSLPHVPRSKAKPGDLVYSPGHIGLYIGDGKMIHAPQSGRTVEIAPLHGNTVGIARPPA
jgi:cell wall-associated NlpC family hydrolase